jgi:hypothetical protein
MTCPDCDKQMDRVEQYYSEKDDIICMFVCACGTRFEGTLKRIWKP